MNTMAAACPDGLRSRSVRLATGPAAVPEARGHVRETIRSWEVPIDPDAAILLTSELVTNAVRHAGGPAVTLVITCSRGQLRVDVHDASPCMPAVADAPADAESGRGLLLVAALSAGWGCYPTPAGKAVYFTLEFQPGPAPSANGRAPRPSELRISQSARK
jgi:anti-sigma regulatory factor (Ser/Thr protein kinase)